MKMRSGKEKPSRHAKNAEMIRMRRNIRNSRSWKKAHKESVAKSGSEWRSLPQPNLASEVLPEFLGPVLSV